MASGAIHQHTRDLSEPSDPKLYSLLSNSLILRQTVPYLPTSALLKISATSHAFRSLICDTPGVFRHVDLTSIKVAQFDVDRVDHGGETWRNVQLDEYLTEDDFYSGPLRGVFRNLGRASILQDVQTLVLDGLSVTAELINDVLIDTRFHVRILSIREVKNLNERKLMQSLQYACRRTRPDGTPRLRGLYVFGKRDAPMHAGAGAGPAPGPARSTAPSTSARIGIRWNHRSNMALKAVLDGEGEDWYHKRGKIISRPIADGWAEALLTCREAIHFDAVLCTGPRHQNSPAFGKVQVPAVPGGPSRPWSVATFGLGGCASCGCAPEGLTVHGESPSEQLPLLAPLPLHSSNVKAATRPDAADLDSGMKPGFVPRCWDCIRDRYCFSCDQWWCESCYQAPTDAELQAAQHVHIVDDANGLSDHEMAASEPPKVKGWHEASIEMLEASDHPEISKIKRECWECQNNCLDCIAQTQMRCRVCGGGYCIIHHEGSTMTMCDWCSTRGRRIPTSRAYGEVHGDTARNRPGHHHEVVAPKFRENALVNGHENRTRFGRIGETASTRRDAWHRGSILAFSRRFDSF